MLNKEVCKKCCTYHSGIAYWCEEDERSWENDEVVFCYHGLISISKIPEKCLYYMEHLVLSDKNITNETK